MQTTREFGLCAPPFPKKGIQFREVSFLRDHLGFRMRDDGEFGLIFWDLGAGRRFDFCAWTFESWGPRLNRDFTRVLKMLSDFEV